MSLTEVLSGIRSLSRSDKIRAIQMLASELGHDGGDIIEAGQSYPIWSPDRAYSAAGALLQELQNGQSSS
jgi:hypothetical protein